MTSSKLQPALLGGAFIGVLSALPIVSAGNVCCCLWMVTGGALAAWVMQQRQQHPITPADGAATGFLAGLIGAAVYVVVASVLVPVLSPLREVGFDRLLDDVPDVSPEARELMEYARGPVVGVAVGFVLQLGFGMVFSTIGGLIGALLFRKAPPVAPPPPPPPVPTRDATFPGSDE
jgi:hypothetical protein